MKSMSLQMVNELQIKASRGPRRRMNLSNKTNNDREMDAAFTAIAQAKVSAMLVGGGAFLTSRRHQLVRLAALHKIPAIYVTRQHTEAGGLISYGASNTDAYCRASGHFACLLNRL